MACNCPHEVKSRPPEPPKPRYEVLARGEVIFTGREDTAHGVASYHPGSTVREATTGSS